MTTDEAIKLLDDLAKGAAFTRTEVVKLTMSADHLTAIRYALAVLKSLPRKVSA